MKFSHLCCFSVASITDLLRHNPVNSTLMSSPSPLSSSYFQVESSSDIRRCTSASFASKIAYRFRSEVVLVFSCTSAIVSVIFDYSQAFYSLEVDASPLLHRDTLSVSEESLRRTHSALPLKQYCFLGLAEGPSAEKQKS